MRFVPRTLGAAVAAVGVAVVVPAIGSAADEPSAPGPLRVSPATARPGGEVELRAWGCEGRRGVATSRAFVVAAPLAPAPTGGELFAEAMIRSTAEPGGYDVTVRCAGHVREATTRVRVDTPDHPRADAPATLPDDAASPPTRGEARPHPALTPVAPVRAGGGATADERHEVAADPEATPDGDLGVAEAYGLALAGGTALTLGGMALRRRGRAGRPGH
ncbi:hypothetical protein [Streptomyces sp. NPDC057702]|uniref:hypothetical protein n=1 Tax=unclassified Streptomyces TaxID=2593676 RepID=UPI00369D9BDE